ncbi:MAG: hypothetical protein OEZ57_15670 [Nitrospirota bacterium]|nr:hypothetical protein [Nitrospirota bacterium]MDH5776342.1 hypothetical protein [Nitrospirota bacterium]
MKNILSIIVLLIFTESVYADTFYVGGKQLNIPSPNGFSPVTEQMDAVYRLSLQMAADPMSDQLAYYIPESEIPVAMAGEIPLHLQRFFYLKVDKKLKDTVLGSKEFAEFKSVIKRQNTEILKLVESKISNVLKETSNRVSKELDVNLALQLSQMVPLDPHYETDNAIAYSMYLNGGVEVEGEKEDIIVSGTVTIVNVAGKILLLVCGGPQEDLEWTRNASKAWADSVMASNSEPPARSPGGRGMDWNRVIEKGIVGAITVGLMALIFGVFSRFKKKKG